MLKKFTYIALFILLCYGLKANSSEGTPFLTNFIYTERSHNHIWSIDQTHSGSILIAKRTGLLEFDSKDWTPISTPDIPLKIKTSHLDEKIYIAGRNFAGYLALKNNGRYGFTALDTLDNKHLYTQIFEFDSSVYFYSSTLLLKFRKETGKTTFYSFENQGMPSSGCFPFKDKVYINFQEKGVSFVSDTGLTPIKSPDLFTKNEIRFSCQFDSLSQLIGLANGNLFLFNGKSFQPYFINDTNFLSSGALTGGLVMDDSLLVLSTKNLGVILVNKYNGVTRTIINQEAGLPSNNVTAVINDTENGLWLAHTKGLSRTDTKLPVMNYSSFPGLDASIYALHNWNELLFLATSNGVYTLDSINLYDTKEMVRKIPLRISYQPNILKPKTEPEIISRKSVKPVSTNKVEDSDNTEKKKIGFLSKLFKKKNADSTIQVTTEEKKEKEEKNEETIKPQRVQAIRKRQKFQTFTYETFVLKSKTYGFSRLDNITEPCNYFLPFGNKLLAISDANIYAINKDKSIQKVFSSSYIYHVSPSKNDKNLLYIITAEGAFWGQLNNNIWKFNLQNKSDNNIKITSLVELSENTFILALNNQLVFYSTENESIHTIEIENPYSERILLKSTGTKNYIIVGNELFELSGDKVENIRLTKKENISIIVPYLNQQSNFWVKGRENSFSYFGKELIPNTPQKFLRVFENITDIHIDNNQNIWVTDNYEFIYKINSNGFDGFSSRPEVIIKHIETRKGKWLDRESVNLNYSGNAVKIKIFSPSYLHFNSNQYQYNIIGLTDNWTEWSTDNIINLPYIPAGKYTVQVRARNILGNISDIKSISLKVSPPFWQTYYFYIGIVLFVTCIVFLLQRYRMKKLVREKRVLSEKVKERTLELELKNKSITDSINYAGKMQSGLLPTEEAIDALLSDSFILYKPKDIVSGDFYWATKKNKCTVIAAADCTGHGVPGAFMSMLGMAYISEIVSRTELTTASEVLETLRKKIIRLLSQRNAESRDGMDIALLIFDKEKQELQYAGAHNPLYRLIAKSNVLNEDEKKFISKENATHYLLHYKADRFQVGKSNFSEEKYTNHVIQYYPDDTFYIFSDGFPDQFGGENERKFMYGPFKKLFLEIVGKPMEEQKNMMDNTIKDWMKDIEQTDDMLVFGIRP